jgi:uncharacterized repeat protein (TIGR03837 family)
MPQRRYDELLWACDTNFVRGEDSFVRAQWAARPFIWQPYAQEENAHHRKLDAFLALYGGGLAADAREALVMAMNVWNQTGRRHVSAGAVWKAFIGCHAALLAHAQDWAGTLSARGELASNLAQFCCGKLK